MTLHDQREFFETQGYLVAEDLMTQDELNSCESDLE